MTLLRLNAHFAFGLGLFALPCLGQGVIVTVAGTSKIFAARAFPALTTPIAPVGLAIGPNGDIYFADQPSNQVLKLSQGSLTVVAGNGFAGFSGDGGPAVAAALAGPTAVTVASNGNVFIADQNNHRVRRVTLDGSITTVAGNGQGAFSGDGGPAVAASLAFPSSVAVDSSGNLLIADVGNRRIRRISAAGSISTVAGNGQQNANGDGGPAVNAGFVFPQEIATDTRGNFYIADAADNSIRRVDSTGTISTFAGTHKFGFSGDGGPAASATLALPRGVSADANGNVYFADLGSNHVRRVNPAGIIDSIAGTGLRLFSGDGGPAGQAGLAAPSATVVDSTGRVFVADTGNSRIRQIAGAIITTIAGNGLADALRDNGPSRNATVSSPGNLAFTSGNLYIADVGNGRIRVLRPDGTIYTLAGNGSIGFSGDGGPSDAASLSYPVGVAVAGGDVFIADRDNHRIRRVRSGLITTVAGTGTGGYGTGDIATSTQLAFPSGVATDAAGNFYIADSGNNVVRRVTPSGAISTLAGTSVAGFSGDGGRATLATLNYPTALAVDSAGNVFVSDTRNQRIRKIDTAGNISTVAGNGATGYAGQGGIATEAQLNSPLGIAIDQAGNLYLADTQSSRILKVDAASKRLTLFAGTGESGLKGDGGLATDALIQIPGGVAIDPSGNVYIADRDNHRIREVLATAPTFSAAPLTVSFSAAAGGPVTPLQSVNVSSLLNAPGLASPSTPGLLFSVQSSVPWLSVTPGAGSLATRLDLTADPTALGPGSYAGTITVTAPQARPPVRTIAVSFNVAPTVTSRLGVGSEFLSFAVIQGAAASTAQLSVVNLGSGSMRYAASASSSTGGNWLSISSPAGSLSPAPPVSITVTAAPSNLAVGTYQGTVTVTSPDTGQLFTIPVSLTVSAPPKKIILSQAGLTFVAVAQGGSGLPQSIGILNGGGGSMDWTATATALSAPGWLSVASSRGTVQRPFLDVGFTDIAISAQGLAAGKYYGRIDVSASGASNSPQSVMVVLNVLPPGSNPGPDLRPSGLVFTTVEGTDNPGSQSVQVANVTATPLPFGTAVGYVTPGTWLDSKPANDTIAPNSPAQITVQPNLKGLAPGVRRAGLTILLDDGNIRTLTVLSVVAPVSALSGDATRNAGTCNPKALFPTFTQLGSGGANAPAGWPISILAKVVDDCGVPMTDGSVTASFSNSDPPVRLVSLQNGTWSGTWQARNASATGVTVTVKAEQANITGTLQSTISLQGTETLPVISAAPVSAAALTQGPLSPGELVFIKGSDLANSTATSGSTPSDSLAGASVLVGGRQASLLYADSRQMVARVPLDVPPNTPQQIVVLRNASLGIPQAVAIADAMPAIFTRNELGSGQGAIYKTSGSAAPTLAESSSPARAGDSIILYCTGLGAIDSQGRTLNAAALSIGGRPAAVSYSGTALPDSYPSSGAPALLGGVVSTGWGGLYQITATVPSGLPTGALSAVITMAGQSSHSGVTLAVVGEAGSGPQVTSIATAGNFLGIAQNTWIAIKGSNLAPASVGTNGLTWSSAPEFASGRMPTQLGGVSVTVNGRPAFIYYVSPSQVNVLTPLDSNTGNAEIVVAHGGVSSAPFSVRIGQVAPSFIPVGATTYVVGTHADNSLVGPISLSAPGYPFTPARRGETITLYAFGLGLPSTTLVNGAATQTGSLPTLPVIRVGGAEVTVAFAGVVSPGLYQLNITLPNTLPVGDNTITLSVQGQQAPPALLTIQ